MTTTEKADSWYWAASIICPLAIEELFSYLVFENGALGIEEQDELDSKKHLMVSFPADIEEVDSLLASISNELSGADGYIHIEKIEKKKIENWQANWQKFFKPIEVGKNFIIYPPWEIRSSSKKHIIIYPGFGFGTGYHESTNLALQLLEWLYNSYPAKTVIDVGTGSGILTIAAFKLGAEEALAVDIDEFAIKEVTKNLELSGIDPARCNVKQMEPFQISQTAPLVLANIEDYILNSISKDLIRITDNGGYLLLSGILTDNKNELLAHFSDDMEIIMTKEMAEWTGIILQKK